jgi:hypothetical protein
MNIERFKDKVARFVRSRSTGVAGEYTMCEGGEVTLYGSCFAAMTLHYLGELESMDDTHLREWSEYIQRWQDPDSGLFVGPELVLEDITSYKHSYEHLAMHLAVHVLPALTLLDSQPLYPLWFAHRFENPEYLDEWLSRIDWREAWLHGNDLLFVGQLLIYLREVEEREGAALALERYFEWLDGEMDPRTGLWGTNGFCDEYEALYGGYHQLLVYYCCGRGLPYAERTIDTVLQLQRDNGGFSKLFGSGACEDVDAVDVLVNLFERTGYRRRAVRRALRAAISCVLRHQMPDGGFVYRHNALFNDMSLKKTHAPPNTSNLFATWFRVHTLALACQVVGEHPLSRIPWQFNKDCSMGWHDTSTPHAPLQPEPWPDYIPVRWSVVRKHVKRINPMRPGAPGYGALKRVWLRIETLMHSSKGRG